MNSDNDQKINQLQEIRREFRARFSVLQKTKETFLKLFRSRLEEKKIQEIKDQLSQNNPR